MIQVIPSIAIRKGKVVKMRKGDPLSEKKLTTKTRSISLKGSKIMVSRWCHLVDLDGFESAA